MSEAATPSATGLRGDQPFKLGVFCLNLSGGASMSKKASGKLTWDFNQRIGQEADRAGWDFLLPLGRWRGLGGETNPNGGQFEVFTWAAAMAAVTEKITVMSTVQVPVMHPIVAAKQAATIDRISGGRYAMNLVAGWNAKEFAMFGLTQKEHDDRYDAADEWLTVMELLWEEGADPNFEGEYYGLWDGYLEPKPVQQPRIPIVSAGQSSRGMEFALTRANYIFVGGHNMEALAATADRTKATRSTLGSQTEMLTHSPVVIADTNEEAERIFSYYVDEHGDWEAALGVARGMLAGGNKSNDLSDEALHGFARGLISGWAGLPLVGTAERIAEDIVRMHELGVHGVGLTWFDYETGVSEFNEKVTPLLIQAGVRHAI